MFLHGFYGTQASAFFRTDGWLRGNEFDRRAGPLGDDLGVRPAVDRTGKPAARAAGQQHPTPVRPRDPRREPSARAILQCLRHELGDDEFNPCRPGRRCGQRGQRRHQPRHRQALTFHGAPSVNIPAGEVVYSDPFDYNLPAQTNLAISIYFGSLSATTINGHPGSRTTSFIQSGNVVSAANLPTGELNPALVYHHRRRGSGRHLQHGASDIRGFHHRRTGSTTDGNNRWPDDLAQRLNTNAPTAGVAVDNMGIGGGGIFSGLGPAGLNRFDRDVLNQSGARWLIVFIGVNDIGGGTSSSSLITAYTQFANKAHARGLLAYGATITPFGGNSYYTTAHEATRQTVNAWFRTNNIYDGVIDFDAVVRDPVTLTNIQSAYYFGANAGDGLHMNPAGYQAMANSIDLTLFTQ